MLLSKSIPSFIKAMAVLAIMVQLLACGTESAEYQKQAAIPDAAWTYAFQPDFKINITDTSARYQMYFVIRHDETYPYANIWFRFLVKQPGDSVFRKGPRIEKELADIRGKWLGKGINNIWEHKIPLGPKETPAFRKAGLYEIKIEQIMRTDPLPAVLNVGLILEKHPKP